MQINVGAHQSNPKRGPGKSPGQPAPLAYADRTSRYPGRNTSDIRFSGGVSQLIQSATEKMLPFFQKTTEVFLFGFLAQDAGMITSRIFTSLRVGREEYDPQQDPQARNLPFAEQLKKWVAGNVKGLNWVNCREDFIREIFTGLGVLSLPTVVYALARSRFGKSAAELSYSHLTEMSDGLIAHLQNSGLADAKQVALPQYKAEAARYFSNAFIDPKLKDVMLPDGGKNYRQFLDQWAEAWVDAVFESPDAKTKTARLTTLSDELKKTLVVFNRKHRLEAYQFTHGAHELLVEKPLHRSMEAWVAFDRTQAPKQEALSAITDNLRRFSDLVEAVWKQKSEQFGLTKDMPSGMLANMIKAAKEKLVVRKMRLALGITVLGGLYLTKLAFWAQSHNTYAATRLLKDTPAGKTSQGQNIVPAADTAPLQRFSLTTGPVQPQIPQQMSASFAQQFPVRHFNAVAQQRGYP